MYRPLLIAVLVILVANAVTIFKSWQLRQARRQGIDPAKRNKVKDTASFAIDIIVASLMVVVALWRLLGL